MESCVLYLFDTQTTERPCLLGDAVAIGDVLTFDRFYHMTKHSFSAIDIDKDNTIKWSEFRTHIDWTLNQYNHEITQSNVGEMAETCLRLTFEKGIIRVMRSRLNEKLNPLDGLNFRDGTPRNFVDHTATFIILHYC